MIVASAASVRLIFGSAGSATTAAAGMLAWSLCRQWGSQHPAASTPRHLKIYWEPCVKIHLVCLSRCSSLLGHWVNPVCLERDLFSLSVAAQRNFSSTTEYVFDQADILHDIFIDLDVPTSTCRQHQDSKYEPDIASVLCQGGGVKLHVFSMHFPAKSFLRRLNRVKLTYQATKLWNGRRSGGEEQAGGGHSLRPSSRCSYVRRPSAVLLSFLRSFAVLGPVFSAHPSR